MRDICLLFINVVIITCGVVIITCSMIITYSNCEAQHSGDGVILLVNDDTHLSANLY